MRIGCSCRITSADELGKNYNTGHHFVWRERARSGAVRDAGGNACSHTNPFLSNLDGGANTNANADTDASCADWISDNDAARAKRNSGEHAISGTRRETGREASPENPGGIAELRRGHERPAPDFFG